MQTVQGNMLESLTRVSAFLDEHAELLPGVAKSGARTRLDAAIARLDDHVNNQGKSNIEAKKSTQSQHALRAVLVRDHMSVIARIARATLPNTPEVAALRMPKISTSLARLGAAAHEMANGADTATSYGVVSFLSICTM